MLGLQQRLQQRYPDWFRGRRGRVVAPLLRGVARWSRFDAIDGFLAESGHLRGFAFVDAALRHLQLKYSVDDAGRGRIPPKGRLLIVANHPSGALDALALLDLVGQVRRDVRIVANEVLALVEPLSDLLLPIRILGGNARPDSLRAIERALENEQCVIVFPAGEVSRLGPRGIRDSRWRRGFLRFARTTGAPVLPIRIEARNSSLFYGVSALSRPASTALLAREMYARCNRPLRLRVGRPLDLSGAGDTEATLRQVRQTLYAMGRRRPAEPAGPEPLAGAVDPKVLVMAVEATELLGGTSDGKQIRLLQCAGSSLSPQDPILLELGRLRELTFRQVGEGTGRSRDLDGYDPHYQHILVWDAEAMRIAGAYRVVRGAQALARSGLAGLYTASLFRYADDSIAHLAEGMELGRSFVVPDYWGSRSLDYLWQGIGAYLLRYPRVRYLFGAVSISAALPVSAREQLVAYYQRYYGSEEALAASARPFRYFAAPPSFDGLDADAAYDVLKANLSALGATVPTLYRQYTDLCEPGGARFLAFGVDPAFSDSIDGLIEVDLHCVRPKKRRRYLQPSGALPA